MNNNNNLFLISNQLRHIFPINQLCGNKKESATKFQKYSFHSLWTDPINCVDALLYQYIT